MKTNKFFLAMLAIAALVACNPDEGGEGTGSQNEPVQYDCTASIEETAGLSWSWAAKDEITVYDGKKANSFVTTAGGETATFSGLANKHAEYLTAIYPATKSSVFGGKMAVSVPVNQTGVKDGIDKKNLLLTAYLKPVDAKALGFKNMLGLVKVTVPESESIVAIELKGNSDEALAGNVSLTVNAEPKVEAAADASKTVIVSGDLLAGTYYIAVLPQTLSSGYTLSFTNSADSRATVTKTDAVTIERNGVVDLGTYTEFDWLEAKNPNPTTVPSVNVVKASFKEAEFNVISDGDFEYFDGQRSHLDQRSSWRVMLEATTVPGQSGNSAVHLVNNVPGRWWDPAIQSTPLVPNTTYVYTAWGKSNTQYCYNGVCRHPGAILDGGIENKWSEIGGHPGDKARNDREGENGTHGWAPNIEWTAQSIEFNSGACFYCDVFCRIAGDGADAPPLIPGTGDGYIEFDNFRLIPKGYEHMSMEHNGFEVLGGVKNSTFDNIDDLGKVVAWENVDGKLAMCLSDFTVNGVHYDNAIVLTDNEDATAELSISKFIKKAGKPLPFIEAAEGEIAIVPNDAFVVGDKVYMHYYAKTSQDEANAEIWTIAYSGFAVSEDGGKTWTKCDGSWKGTGCFAQAGFYEKDGFLYMVASRAGRETTTYWANMYVAKCDMSADFTDPANWEYWNAYEWIAGDETASDTPVCCLTVGPRSEPQLVYNEKFGRWMMVYRSGILGGLAFRDSEEIQGPWSGEKIVTLDEVAGLSFCPSIMDQTAEGDLLMVVPQL